MILHCIRQETEHFVNELSQHLTSQTRERENLAKLLKRMKDVSVIMNPSPMVSSQVFIG